MCHSRPSAFHDMPLTPVGSLVLTRTWLRAGWHTIGWCEGMQRFQTPHTAAQVMGGPTPMWCVWGSVSQCSCLLILSSNSLDLASVCLWHWFSGFYTHAAVPLRELKCPLPCHNSQGTPFHPCCLLHSVPHGHSTRWTWSYPCNSCRHHRLRAEYDRGLALVAGSASVALLPRVSDRFDRPH